MTIEDVAAQLFVARVLREDHRVRGLSPEIRKQEIKTLAQESHDDAVIFQRETTDEGFSLPYLSDLINETLRKACNDPDLSVDL